MKKVTVKNLIRDFIFLTAAETLCIDRHDFAFSTNTPIWTSLSFFFSFFCLHSWRTDFSFCYHLLLIQSRMVLVYQNQKNYQVSQKNSKKPHLITSWNYSLQVVETLHEKCPNTEFFWSVFSRIRTEYGEILRISWYSVWMRENTDQINSAFGQFSRSWNLLKDI